MTMHYTANVCRIDAAMATGSIVPTDESHEHLDPSRSVIDFFLGTDNRWKASRFYDPKTGDRGMVPDCFSPPQKFYLALDAAWCQTAPFKPLGRYDFEVEDR